MSGITRNALAAFAFHGSNVRVELSDDGTPWFVARDVAACLEYARFDINLLAHVPAEWKGTKPIRTPGGVQQLAVLSEQGVYFFVARSDKPRAIPFQKWLAGEVVPSIRRTGRYGLPTQAAMPQIPQTFAQALRLAADLHEQVQQQAAQLEQAQPAIHFTQQVADLTGLLYIGEIGKALGHGRTRFFKMLRAANILMDNRLPYQRYIDAGWFEVVEREPWANSKGELHPALTTMVTGKGQIQLARRFPHPDDAARAAHRAGTKAKRKTP